MKTAIVYYSKHHGNTRKLVDAIAKSEEVDLFNVSEDKAFDLSEYDRIGFASGVYAGNVAKQIVEAAEKKLPEGKEVFYLYTSAVAGDSALSGIRKVAESRNCKEIGVYHCKGYNTFGPFKLVGGTAKGHPTDEEIRAAVYFYKGL